VSESRYARLLAAGIVSEGGSATQGEEV